ncbi:MAG: HEAT repeat domain-containing protein [Myxococcales bacterium]|nr:HEAT repeat domain-containing protein [Myxococcales bacterium]
MSSDPSRRPPAPWLLVVAATVACVLSFAPIGDAQSDHSTVIRVLRTGRDFRARARAALALGSSNDRSVVPELIQALADDSPAVRAAAATALGRLQDPRAVAVLRARLSDSEAVVRSEAAQAIRRIEAANGGQPGSSTVARRGTSRLPAIAVVPRARDVVWPRIHYVVVLGSMENRSRFRDDTLGDLLASEVSRNLLVLRGVATFRDGQIPPEAEREIQRRRLPKLRLEGSLNRVEPRIQSRQLTVRCEVSLMLMDDPGRNMRSVLNGAATGASPRSGARATQEQALARQALSGAVRSAMQGAARAISSATR